MLSFVPFIFYLLCWVNFTSVLSGTGTRGIFQIFIHIQNVLCAVLVSHIAMVLKGEERGNLLASSSGLTQKPIKCSVLIFFHWFLFFNTPLKNCAFAVLSRMETASQFRIMCSPFLQTSFIFRSLSWTRTQLDFFVI